MAVLPQVQAAAGALRSGAVPLPDDADTGRLAGAHLRYSNRPSCVLVPLHILCLLHC
jgi:hypothetical protein